MADAAYNGDKVRQAITGKKAVAVIPNNPSRRTAAVRNDATAAPRRPSACTMSVAAGEGVVCGPSGSGKSTLPKYVNGLEAFDSGTIHVGGASVGARGTDLPALRAAPAWWSEASPFIRT